MWVVDEVDRLMRPLLDQSHLDVAWHAGQYQALPPVYVQNSALEIAWTRVVEATGTREGRVLAPFFTEGYEGLNIDDEEDFARAERLHRRRSCEAARISGVAPYPSPDVGLSSPPTTDGTLLRPHALAARSPRLAVARATEAIALVVVLAALVVYVAPTLDAPLLEKHAFRQTQTAWTARVFHEDGVDLLHPKLPVFGEPFEAPFEFPLFQALATVPMAAGVAEDDRPAL